MSRMHGTKEMWIEGLRADGPAFLAAATGADPATPVPSRPAWTMADLIHHLGTVYRFVDLHAVRGVTTKPDRSMDELTAEPHAADLAAWWQGQFEAILATLDALDPEMPAWNWAPQAKQAGFWQRRVAHETALHRWDAQMAIGLGEPLEAKLAADAVSEVLDTWLPAGRRVGPTDVTGLIALEAADLEHDWHVRLRGEGVALLDTDTIFDDDELRTRAVATGTASDLVLALHGRVGFDVLEITGDEHLLSALRVV